MLAFLLHSAVAYVEFWNTSEQLEHGQRHMPTNCPWMNAKQA